MTHQEAQTGFCSTDKRQRSHWIIHMTVGAADDCPHFPLTCQKKKKLLKEWKWIWLSSEKSQDATCWGQSLQEDAARLRLLECPLDQWGKLLNWEDSKNNWDVGSKRKNIDLNKMTFRGINWMCNIQNTRAWENVNNQQCEMSWRVVQYTDRLEKIREDISDQCVKEILSVVVKETAA